MASTYSTNLKIEIMATGENSGTWGTITNTNLGTALEQAIVGYGNPSFASDANLTLTYTDTNAAQAARALVLNVTSAVSLTGTRELVVPTIQKQYIVQNNTTGSQSITVKTSGGTGITVPNGRKAHLYVDGTNVIQMFDFVDINGGAIDGTTVGASSASTGAFTTLTASGATTLNGAVALGDAAADLITVPGTVNSNVIFTDNTFDIGASGATRPRTGYFGTSVLSPLVTATNVQVTNIKANDGTVAVTITDSTGAVGVSTAFTLSTATGNIALGTSQTSGTFTVGGTAATGAITLDQSTKAHTLNIGTGATENATTKTINIGTGGVSGSTTTITIGSSDGTTTTFNGTVNVTTLDLTNLEVTNIKAKDGTASITLADSTGVATLSANPILNAGTANGVAFLNASKVLTTGSALTFDGTNFTVGVSATTGDYKTFIQKAGGELLGLNASSGTLARLAFGNTTATFGSTQIIANAADLAFITNSAEQMRLTSTGLGIGTSSPGAKLQVAWSLDQLKFTNPSAGFKQIGASYTGYVSGNDYSAIILGTDGSSGGKIQFSVTPSSGSLTTAATLDQNGNLGIGTPTPDNKLEVTVGDNAGINIEQSGVGQTGFLNFRDFDGALQGRISYDHATDALRFATSNTEKVRLTSTGTLNITGAGSAGTTQAISFNGSTPVDTLVTTSGGLVGIGTSSPGAQLDISTTVSATGAILRLSNQSNTISVDEPHGTIQFFSGDDSSAADTVVSSIISAQATTAPNEGYLKFLTGNNTEKLRISSDGTFRVKGAGSAGSTDAFQVAGTAPADAARITSGGFLLVGSTDDNPANTGTSGFAYRSGSSGFLSISSSGNYAGWLNREGSDGNVLMFGRATNQVGSVSVTASATAYNTSSDYRLKYNPQPLTNSGAFIDALKPKTWNWKADGSKGVGFIAHEVQEVSPGSVVGEKDGEQMQAMEYGSAEFIANIVAELQSLRARVAQLEQGA
jgi:hypothetical protein